MVAYTCHAVTTRSDVWWIGVLTAAAGLYSRCIHRLTGATGLPSRCNHRLTGAAGLHSGCIHWMTGTTDSQTALAHALSRVLTIDMRT